jgi:hypothetical protein
VLFVVQAKLDAHGYQYFQENAWHIPFELAQARNCRGRDERVSQTRPSKRRMPKHPPPALASTASQVTRPWKSSSLEN